MSVSANSERKYDLFVSYAAAERIGPDQVMFLFLYDELSVLGTGLGVIGSQVASRKEAQR